MKTFIDRLFYGNYWLGTKTATFPFINAIALFGTTAYLFTFWLFLLISLFMPMHYNEDNEVMAVSAIMILSLIFNVLVMYFTNKHYKRAVNFLRAKRKVLELKLVWKLLYALSSFITVALIFLLSFFMR